MNMTRENIFLWKVVFAGGAVIVIIGLLFFNFGNLITWMTLNNPFQGQWAVVQLSDGEILYGHLSGVSGSTIGLTDVYSLDKVVPIPASSTTETISSSTSLSVTGGIVAPTIQPKLVPVSDAPNLYVNRTAVLYFKYVTPDDPVLPSLH